MRARHRSSFQSLCVSAALAAVLGSCNAGSCKSAVVGQSLTQHAWWFFVGCTFMAVVLEGALLKKVKQLRNLFCGTYLEEVLAIQVAGMSLPAKPSSGRLKSLPAECESGSMSLALVPDLLPVASEKLQDLWAGSDPLELTTFFQKELGGLALWLGGCILREWLLNMHATCVVVKVYGQRTFVLSL